MLSVLISPRSVLKNSRILNFCRNNYLYLSPTIRCKSDNIIVTIDDVVKEIESPCNPEYVPRKYLSKNPSQETLRNLRWMLQKDILGQDIFLIGAPGPRRRNLALAFLELTGREVEFIALSRDTTEADLKQRREIANGTATYHDQSAVRAAKHGRILILEGIEKAERNVLPILNNLLENREMHLEDGRFLVSATRYDKLMETYSKAELDAWRLIRVSENFRVIALGIPSPRYPGHPLDPPLRSRFQAKHISPPTFQEQLEMLKSLAPNADIEKLSQLLSCCHAIVSKEAIDIGLPDFPLDNLLTVATILEKFPNASVFDIFYKLYPYKLFLGKEGKNAVEDILNTFNVLDGNKSNSNYISKDQIVKIEKNNNSCLVTVSKYNHETTLNVCCGMENKISNDLTTYIETNYQNNLLTDMVLSHSTTDYCLIGPKGCGKSTVVNKLADDLGYEVEPIVLYNDMTSRDLIQQRTTLPNGDTVWKDSALISAALNGKLAVLDGIHRVHSSILAVLHRLIHNREIQLHDGKRLMKAEHYDEIKNEYAKTDQDMMNSGIYRIHPSFRIISLAEPPVIGVSSSSASSGSQWINSELMSLFNFHEMRPLQKSEEIHIINSKYGEPSSALLKVIELAHRLRSSTDPTLQSLAGSLSTRQLLRIAERMSKYPNSDAYDAVNRACLTRFLPAVPKQALVNCMKQIGIHPVNTNVNKKIQCIVENDCVKIGDTIIDRYKTLELSKVPNILFYDVPQHLILLEKLIQDFILGQHLLLVGNQGVGKNKIVDRLLQLMNRPREYIQLHRDTTVQTLTLQPTVRDGVVIYEDSPLVHAVKLGHVLVIDEADKAPTHVTCILKTLAESGEMILSDGRRIVSHLRKINDNSTTIIMHPDFRIIVLANRPGFPFLGNDFFGALGDLFSTHSVDNPTLENEISLLKQYGPNVDDKIIQKLVRAFGELRSMSDQGLVSYPYSTREVVNIVKHLQKFPNEPLANVVQNVFDFDRYTTEIFDTLVRVLHKHGIPIGTSLNNIALAKEFSLPQLKYDGSWSVSQDKVIIPVQERLVKSKARQYLQQTTYPLDRIEARSAWFTEIQSYWTIPCGEAGYITAVAVTKGTTGDRTDDKIHALTINPACISTMTPLSDSVDQILIQSLMGPSKLRQPEYTIAVDGLGNLLIYEENSNTLISLNLNEKSARVIQLLTFLETASDRLSQAFGNEIPTWKLLTDLMISHSKAVFYTPNSNKIEILDLKNMIVHSMSLPCMIKSLTLPSPNKFLIQSIPQNLYVLENSNDTSLCPNILRQIKTTDSQSLDVNMFTNSGIENLNKNVLSLALKQNIDSPNRLIASDFAYANLIVGFPELDSKNEFYMWPRKERITNNNRGTIVTGNGEIIRVLPAKHIPNEALIDDGKRSNIYNYLEVVDIANEKLRYLPIATTTNRSSHSRWLYPHDIPVYIAATSNCGLISVDATGGVKLWEISTSHIKKSLLEWRKTIVTEDGSVQVTKERFSGLDATAPKHGKVDSQNKPHVGGNQWAGGTGGRDTAGLGGKGGPYRLDAGHTVHQLSDKEKNSVPDHVKKAAREMGIRAFKQRLKDIHMSEYDHTVYSQFRDVVSKQIKTLRVILDSLQTKSHERQWLRHQTSGELDDTKLIEGLTGERTIYRRRSERESEIGVPQLKPKHLKLVVDVSGSMYRFNSYDGRLDRELEACVMVMEAFCGYEGKFQYDIVGHSGDQYNIPFVDHHQPPVNNQQRLEIIQTMYAHSQYCSSGDHTLEATRHAIATLAKENTDESIVVVLSDANLERYGIRPEHFAKLLTSSPEVNAFAIFIGSLGDQATRVMHKMPSGRAFVCMDLQNIPQILQQIFTASVLNARSS